MSDFTIRRAEWDRDRDALRSVRARVFVQEQNVPPELEWDGLDSKCVHMLAIAGNDAIGTGRLTPDGHIGRMAVVAAWRGHNVGKALLEALMVVARERGDTLCRLNAQLTAIGFYERFGFQTHGNTFMDAGIPHRAMSLQLSRQPNTSASPLPPSDKKEGEEK